MRKSRFSEEQIAYALRQGRERDAGDGALPQARDQRGDVLPVEAEVRRDGNRGAPPRQAAGGGKRPAQAARCRPDPRQGDAPGRARKKILRPAGKRARVGYLQQCYEVSERRACEVLLLRRSSCRYRSCAKDS